MKQLTDKEFFEIQEIRDRRSKSENKTNTKNCWVCEDRERNFIGDECEEHLAVYHRCMKCRKITKWSELDGTDNRGLKCSDCIKEMCHEGDVRY